MSTAANEDVLIKLFKQSHSGLWNGKGFGPKDPGKERDTTKPSWFDEHYPIIEDYPVDGLSDFLSLKELLETMKEKLPYVFRYKVPKSELGRAINLRGVQRRADHLLQKAVVSLGAGWRGTIISYGMLLYKSKKQYPHGRVITSRSPRLP
ncbi:hypothetical protein [Ramlibacter sp.]|uniref:hypothetical protein n=1 Tax=Ramlibacter sp. TaxID=1917967 RepID=UPI002C411790|nr:hypothetical protein [Ramlibacter sp.]HWI81517.1 hypothetical protein [Ramlibacter sp.]